MRHSGLFILAILLLVLVFGTIGHSDTGGVENQESKRSSSDQANSPPGQAGPKVSPKGAEKVSPSEPAHLSEMARLFVETIPPGGKIRILTILPRFSQGMSLKPGPYELEASAKGYKPQRRWVTLRGGEERRVVFRLRGQSDQAKVVWDAEHLKNSMGMSFVRVNPGTFMMGSPATEPGRHDDEQLHQVTLSKGFLMGVTEVTQGQWRKVMGSNPSEFSACGDDCPVENVTWLDCQEFIRRLNQRENTHQYRLPTEAEWEYACRAGTVTALYTGDLTIVAANNGPELDAIAWYGGNSCASYTDAVECSEWFGRQKICALCGTQPVGKKGANAWGLYDMLGNVWEWCSDWFEEYPTDGVTDPKGPSSGEYRIMRGASWENFAVACRSAARYDEDPDYKDSSIGFRLVRDL